MSSHFAGNRQPACLDALDADDHGSVDISDVVFILSYLFTEGPAIPPPVDCGVDLTSDPLGDCQLDSC